MSAWVSTSTSSVSPVRLTSHDKCARGGPRSFGDDRVGSRLDGSWVPAFGQITDPERNARILGERLDGSGQALVGEHGREDPVRELAKVCDCLAQLRVRLVEASYGFRVGAGRLRASEAEGQR